MSDTIIRPMTEEDLAELERAENQPGARIDRSTIPPLLIEGLKAYVEQGRPVGSFLEAVLCNDFVAAVGAADAHSRVALPSIARLVCTEMPPISWGSKCVYHAWIAFHQAQRDGVEGEELQAFADKVSEAKEESVKWQLGQ